MRSVLVGIVTSLALPVVAAPGGARPGAAITIEQDIVYRTVGGQDLNADVYLPGDDGDDRPTVLLVHGGGWIAGSKVDVAQQAQLLAEAGFVAVSVEYRLALESPYPAAVDDLLAAVRWLRRQEQVDAYGIDTHRIGAFGSSAGGHLAALLGSLGEGRSDRRARVAAVVAWSGPMALARAARSIDAGDVDALGDAIAQFLDCTPGDCEGKRARAASPTTHVDETDPPMLLINSDDELVPLPLVEPMADRLAAVDVEHRLLVVAGNLHDGQFGPLVWPDTLAFFQRHLQR
jgi:acetyl esterase